MSKQLLLAAANETIGSTIPTWLGAIGALIVIAAALGAAVAVYRANLATTQVKIAREELASSDATAGRLRLEINDYARRENELEADVKVLKSENKSAKDRILMLEDLMTKRQDDAEIKAEIAAVREVVDTNIMSQLTNIASGQKELMRVLEELTSDE